MSNTYGHTLRRYVGEKLYQARDRAAKYSHVADNGKDADVAPFWMDAFCSCFLTTCPDCGESARFEQEQTEYYELKRLIASWQPEPPSVFTGQTIHVEWESLYGGRWWSTMDAGMLDREIWYRAQCGDALSDIDEPMRQAA